MKKCPKCNKLYADEFSFCNTCGCSLEKHNRNVNIAVIIIAIVAILGIGLALLEQSKMNQTRKDIENYKYSKSLQEYRNTPTISDLTINSNWTTDHRGNYVYIKGTVTNNSSSKTISYFKIMAKFYDSYGNVINSDWTNDGDDLSPGETRPFEIMHRYDTNEVNIKLLVDEVH